MVNEIIYGVIGLIALLIVSSRFKVDVTELISLWQFNRLTRLRSELAAVCIHAKPLRIDGHDRFEIDTVVIGPYHMRCRICETILPILYADTVTEKIIDSMSPKEMNARMAEVRRLAKKVSNLSGWDRRIAGKKDE